jgi:hypothetical protein
MAENFSNLQKDTNIWVQENQRWQVRFNQVYPRHTIIKQTLKKKSRSIRLSQYRRKKIPLKNRQQYEDR